MPKRDPADFRTRLLAARFTEAEAVRHEQRAAAAGVSISDLIRAALDDMPAPRRTARPTADLELLARVLASLGRSGSNMNQLARTANMGGWPDSRELARACADIREMRDVLMLALGVTPPDHPRPGPPAP